VGKAKKRYFTTSGGKRFEIVCENIKRNWKQLADATEGSFEFILNAINSTIIKVQSGEVGETAIYFQSQPLQAWAIATATR
jgi:hypothetical protein